ncbi:MAG: thioredoxin, partial [Acidimicrobiia bacterium]
MTVAPLPDGLVVVVKRDCPTCELVLPALVELKTSAALALTVFVQDDPSFFADLDPVDDGSLAVSYFHDIETVPTLLSVRGGIECARAVGWSRAQWRTLTGHVRLGEQLPEYRPGCGSLSVDPTRADVLAVR